MLFLATFIYHINKLRKKTDLNNWNFGPNQNNNKNVKYCSKFSLYKLQLFV